MDNKNQNVGRNFFDVISEHPKMTLIISGLILLTPIGLIFFKVPFKIGTLEVNPREVLISDTTKDVNIKKNKEPKLIENIVH